MQNVFNLFKDLLGNIRESRSDERGMPIIGYNYRDIQSTGFATLTRAQEGTVLSAIANTYLDVIQVSVTNASTVAVQVTLRSATGGSTEDIISVPASTTLTKNYSTTLVDSEKATAWTAQNTSGGEISDSNVSVQMVAVKNTLTF